MIFRALLPSASSGNAAEALHASDCQRRWKSWLPGPMVLHMFHMPVTSWPLWMVHGCTMTCHYDVLMLGVRCPFSKPRSSYQSHLAMDQEACRRVPKIQGLNGLRALQRPIRWCPARWAPSNQLACFRQRADPTHENQAKIYTCHIHIIH